MSLCSKYQRMSAVKKVTFPINNVCIYRYIQCNNAECQDVYLLHMGDISDLLKAGNCRM